MIKILLKIFSFLLLLISFQSFAQNPISVTYQTNMDNIDFIAKYDDGSQRIVYSVPKSKFYGGFQYIGNGIIEYISNPNINPANNPQAESSFYDINTGEASTGLSPIFAVDGNRRIAALGGLASSEFDITTIFGSCEYFYSIKIPTANIYNIAQSTGKFDSDGNLLILFKDSNNNISWKKFDIDFNQFIKQCDCKSTSC